MGPRLKNAAAWASSNANKVAVGWNARAETLGDYLISQTAFVSDRYTDAGEVKFNRLSVNQVQLLVLIGQDKAIGQYAASIRNFIRAGGGVLIAAQAWYWSYTNPKAPEQHLDCSFGLGFDGRCLRKWLHIRHQRAAEPDQQCGCRRKVSGGQLLRQKGVSLLHRRSGPAGQHDAEHDTRSRVCASDQCIHDTACNACQDVRQGWPGPYEASCHPQP